MYRTFGSITHKSAPVMSVIWPAVRSISPQKIDPCCMMRSAENVRPITIPRNLALSPTSILIAIHVIAVLPPGSRPGRDRIRVDFEGPPRPVEGGGQTESGQTERCDVIGEELGVKLGPLLRPDEPLGDGLGELVMKALAAHAERKGVQAPRLRIGTD